MNKQIKKEINLYIKSISKLAKTTLLFKKVVLKDLKNNIYEYYLDNPNITIYDIHNRFGTPDEVSKSFDNLSSEILIKKVKRYKLLLIFVSILIVVLIIFTVILVLSNLSHVSIMD